MEAVELLIAKVAGLTHIPVATIIGIAGSIVVLVNYIEGNLDVQQFAVSIGAVNAGAGVLGHARNGAGRGVKK
jgi:hypothetical protein